MEYKKHCILKEQAKECLLKDFKEHEIYFEYKIVIDDKKYIIDAVAISPKRKVAIECGVLDTDDRMKKLATIFDKVIHFPYLDRRLSRQCSKNLFKNQQRSEFLLPKMMFEKVYRIAELTETTRSEVIRSALRDYLDKKLLMIGATDE